MRRLLRFTLLAVAAGLLASACASADVAATLIHELVHALNTRSIGPALPPWLDEGLAEDLSYAALGPGGEIRTFELAGKRVEERDRTLFMGPLAILKTMNEELDELGVQDDERLSAIQQLRQHLYEEIGRP